MSNTVSRIVSDETLNRIIQIESAGRIKAKAPTSSALGLFQFLNGTWLDTVEKHRPDLLEDRTKAKVLALRTEPTVCIELGARFTEDNARALGTGWTDGDIYLAHFLGAGTAKKFLRARPDASAAAIAGAKAVEANRSILAGKTAGQVRAWAQGSMVRRWNAAGRIDWIARYYKPTAEHDAPHEVIDHEADDVPVKLDPVEQDDAEAKPLIKSKIGLGGAVVGAGGVGEVVATASDAADKVKTIKETADDIGILDWLGHLAQQPRFWVGVAIAVAAIAIIYWRWRDHGRGKVPA